MSSKEEQRRMFELAERIGLDVDTAPPTEELEKTTLAFAHFRVTLATNLSISIAEAVQDGVSILLVAAAVQAEFTRATEAFADKFNEADMAMIGMLAASISQLEKGNTTNMELVLSEAVTHLNTMKAEDRREPEAREIDND